jgi:hypothetical protein
MDLVLTRKRLDANQATVGCAVRTILIELTLNCTCESRPFGAHGAPYPYAILRCGSGCSLVLKSRVRHAHRMVLTDKQKKAGSFMSEASCFFYVWRIQFLTTPDITYLARNLPKGSPVFQAGILGLSATARPRFKVNCACCTMPDKSQLGSNSSLAW